MINKKFCFILITLIVISCNAAFAEAFQDGVKAYNKQNYIIAEDCFKKALMSDPYNPNVRYYLAITLVKNKRNAEAAKEYITIINTAPDTGAARNAYLGLKLLGYDVNKPKDKVELNINRNSSVIILRDIKVNNRVTTDFILDSGATYTSITPALAKNLGISWSNAPVLKVITANGAVNAPKVYLDSIDINGLVAKDIPVIILDIGSKKEISGLLGLSFINKFKVTIDKKNGKLTLEK